MQLHLPGDTESLANVTYSHNVFELRIPVSQIDSFDDLLPPCLPLHWQARFNCRPLLYQVVFQQPLIDALEALGQQAAKLGSTHKISSDVRRMRIEDLPIDAIRLPATSSCRKFALNGKAVEKGLCRDS